MPSMHQPSFLWSQLFVKLPYPETSFAEKTVIVTGSNVGLGKEAARHFARLGARTVILAVRNLEKGEAAKDDIEASLKIAKDIVQVWELDMASYASVCKFAERAKSLERIDVVVENAGMMSRTKHMAEGNEISMTVNVISTLLLAFLCLPLMKETAEKFKTRPNLVLVASDAHTFAPLKLKSESKKKLFDAINEQDDMSDRYSDSKLVEIFAVRALTERYPAATLPVTVNYITPGLCQSELNREGFLPLAIVKYLLARPAEHGSRSLIHAASVGAETHGQYLYDCHIELPSPLVMSAEGRALQEKVWAELVEKLEAIKPGVTTL